MTDPIKDALRAAVEADGGSPKPERIAAAAIAAFLRALPTCVVHYEDTSVTPGGFGRTPTVTAAELAAAVERAANEA